ncbi:hypothetical protein [Limnobacter sp.]|jgi:hypothetical protein|uniref:hypothetical protein n=1 Tax=Limnobacter sp. TaxID=2003368 RepID=UPI00273362D4|nr:hypothetical protein [Limnobacter sp.]MDP3270357.1 hypothetical protein [Limnobacter sp.]MDZ4049522.1 hypothetical protein [Limnobacter sp.]
MMESFVHFLIHSILLLVVVFPVSLLLLTWSTPASVIDRYVQPPHFSEFESLAYRYFPTSLIRTNLFSLAIAIPFARRIRKFGDIHKDVPLWYNLACRFYVYFVFGYAVFCMAAMGLIAICLKFGYLP